MNFTRISKVSLNKKTLKDIANVTNDEIVRLPSQFKYLQWYIVTLINLKSRLYKPELPKYRRPTSIKFCDAKKSILFSISECIEILCRKKDINQLELADWKNSVTRLLEERVETLTHKYMNIKSSVDKANGNIAICKLFVNFFVCKY